MAFHLRFDAVDKFARNSVVILLLQNYVSVANKLPPAYFLKKVTQSNTDLPAEAAAQAGKHRETQSMT